jgi:hypothetical protein
MHEVTCVGFVILPGFADYPDCSQPIKGSKYGLTLSEIGALGDESTTAFSSLFFGTSPGGFRVHAARAWHHVRRRFGSLS